MSTNGYIGVPKPRLHLVKTDRPLIKGNWGLYELIGDLTLDEIKRRAFNGLSQPRPWQCRWVKHNRHLIGVAHVEVFDPESVGSPTGLGLFQCQRCGELYERVI